MFHDAMAPASLAIVGNVLVVVRLSVGHRTFVGIFGLATKALQKGNVQCLNVLLRYGVTCVQHVAQALLFQLSWPGTSTESILLYPFVDVVVVDAVLLMPEVVDVPVLLLGARLVELVGEDVAVLLMVEGVADASFLAVFVA